jgi:hypothetical protein
MKHEKEEKGNKKENEDIRKRITLEGNSTVIVLSDATNDKQCVGSTGAFLCF